MTWLVPWRGSTASLTVLPRRLGNVAILMDGTEVRRFDRPTLLDPVASIRIGGSDPAISGWRSATPPESPVSTPIADPDPAIDLIQTVSPRGYETEVFVGGVSVKTGESMQDWLRRAPLPMDILEALPYYLRARLIVAASAALVAKGWVDSGLPTTFRAALFSIAQFLFWAITVWGAVVFARRLSRRYPQVGPNVRLFLILLAWAAMCTAGMLLLGVVFLVILPLQQR
jgi:hypothetical protein